MGGMIKCLACGKILHSLYRHDFQGCECDNGTFVDGGFDYMRYGGKDMDLIKILDHTHKKSKTGEEIIISDGE